ncbi:MAG: hypothetical protein LH614_18505 [Pyrinomonadaceae bacterium]|nr:hypothetical protein [Pyrinomonadaceae bacterium]
MKHKNKIISSLLVLTFALAGLACQKTTEAGNKTTESGNKQSVPTVKAQTPTEAYKMLYAAVKAKNTDQIKQLLSQSSLGLAEFSAGQQKKPVEKILENGLVAPTLSDSITEMRDERVKDNFGAVEVFNQKENRWEDLPFILEDGGWKLAVGNLFQDTYKSPGKSKGQIETEASNTMTIMPSNTVTNFPEMTNSNQSVKTPPMPDGVKTVEVPKSEKPKK